MDGVARAPAEQSLHWSGIAGVAPQEHSERFNIQQAPSRILSHAGRNFHERHWDRNKACTWQLHSAAQLCQEISQRNGLRADKRDNGARGDFICEERRDASSQIIDVYGLYALRPVPGQRDQGEARKKGKKSRALASRSVNERGAHNRPGQR